MEIEKIFSEIDTDERMFSVLMDEEELALFSEFEERFYANEDINPDGTKKNNALATASKAALVAGGATGVGAAGYLAYKSNDLAKKIAKKK